jgi:hypothetical protein
MPKKGFAPIIIVLIVALFAGVGISGYIYFQSNKSKNVSVNNTTTTGVVNITTTTIKPKIGTTTKFKITTPTTTTKFKTTTTTKKPTPTTKATIRTLMPPSTTRNLNWEIVFTNTGEQLPDTIKNDLCTGSSTNKLSYLPTWFKREANKYGVSLSISLNCYSQQIELPQNVLINPDHYTAFGQSIPLPLNMSKTRDYILQIIPSSQNYDLITIVDYVPSGGTITDMAFRGSKVSFIFIVKSNFIDGVQYYTPNVTEPNIESDPTFVKGVAHEALHSLGAYDHYDYSNPADCQTETDQSIRYKSPRIMCAANLLNFADYIIPSETAKEIGWIE